MSSRKNSLKAVAKGALAALMVAGFMVAVSPASVAVTAPKDNSASLLEALLPDAGEKKRATALREIAQGKDRRFIAPLIDLLRFVNSRDEYVVLLETLTSLIGEKIEGADNPWEAFTVWYGAHDKLLPPPGYTGWKGELHGQLIDPRFREFLYSDAPSTTRVEEVVWGGVKVDGIPALVNPKMRVAKDADYLVDSEPVFGVSINRDNRAYPLRILDWHEMANDVVGGKPVALAYCVSWPSV